MSIIKSFSVGNYCYSKNYIPFQTKRGLDIYSIFISELEIFISELDH